MNRNVILIKSKEGTLFCMRHFIISNHPSDHQLSEAFQSCSKRFDLCQNVLGPQNLMKDNPF